jgi:acetolactate synthase small subunit
MICGSMFSGKTQELIRRLRLASIARQKVQVFNSALDVRYSKDHIVSHDLSRTPSIAVAHSRDILARVTSDTRVVGVADVHEEIRVQRAMKEVAVGLRHLGLAEAIDRNLQLLARKRLTAYLRELDEKNETLNRELAELTQHQRFRSDIASAERLRTIATEMAEIAREKHFFDRALALGEVHLTHEHFRRAEELIERFAANGFDIREGECLIPLTEIADLTGRSYDAVLRIVTERDLSHEAGLVKVDLAALVRYLI